MNDLPSGLGSDEGSSPVGALTGKDTAELDCQVEALDVWPLLTSFLAFL